MKGKKSTFRKLQKSTTGLTQDQVSLMNFLRSLDLVHNIEPYYYNCMNRPKLLENLLKVLLI
jgi:hypothetical protein